MSGLLTTAIDRVIKPSERTRMHRTAGYHETVRQIGDADGRGAGNIKLKRLACARIDEPFRRDETDSDIDVVCIDSLNKVDRAKHGRTEPTTARASVLIEREYKRMRVRSAHRQPKRSRCNERYRPAF